MKLDNLKSSRCIHVL